MVALATDRGSNSRALDEAHHETAVRIEEKVDRIRTELDRHQAESAEWRRTIDARITRIEQAVSDLAKEMAERSRLLDPQIIAHMQMVKDAKTELTEAKKEIGELKELMIAIKTLRGLGPIVAGLIAAAGVIYGIWRH